MRDRNVNQAERQPVALPQVLEKGVAQQDTKSYKPALAKGSFFIAVWLAAPAKSWCRQPDAFFSVPYDWQNFSALK